MTERSEALGNITKFVTPPHKNGVEERAGRRMARYDLQRISARLVPSARVSGCCWRPVSSTWQMIKHPETQNTHYGPGIMHCGSVWLCPVCSSKITERRRIEIREGLDQAKARGWSVFMVTFTMQHDRDDDLRFLGVVLSDALRAFRRGEPWNRRKAKYKIIGDIRGIEVTVSKAAGWHVHSHMIFFSECQQIDADQVQADFAARWQKILSGAGVYASLENGVDVQAGDSAVGDYVAKMGKEKPGGLDFELAKSGQKTGRANGHYSPFELLELAKSGDAWAGAMFKTYAEAMTGVNQLRWSTDLRRVLGLVEELTDQEITEGAGDTGGVTFYEGPSQEFIILRSFGGRVYTGYLAEKAREMDCEQYAKFIDGLLQLAYKPTGSPRTSQAEPGQ